MLGRRDMNTGSQDIPLPRTYVFMTALASMPNEQLGIG